MFIGCTLPQPGLATAGKCSRARWTGAWLLTQNGCAAPPQAPSVCQSASWRRVGGATGRPAASLDRRRWQPRLAPAPPLQGLCSSAGNLCGSSPCGANPGARIHAWV